MKLPLSWLKEYVDVDISPGEVTECEPIEGTHLHVCKVDCGESGELQICCGADNVRKGIKAPVALIGATVYATAQDHVTVEGVMTIKKGKLRGVDSFGMLCSGAELGVNGDMYEGADYNGLLLLPASCKNGEDVKPILGLNDYIFDIALTANRPDCNSILGMAREVAAVLGKPLKEPAYTYSAKSGGKRVEVEVLAPDLCPRYIAHYVKDIAIAPSPQWLKRRLALCGLRSINNVVDITNYVLLEMGQPMHAFDFAKLENGKITVRRAYDKESIITLDGKTFELGGENLVICDGNKPCALAGIMGGENSEIKDDTRELLFEAAKFARDSVRKTSRALGQHSDSSATFERGVNEYTTERAMARALHLIEELGCGTVTNIHIDIKTPNSHDGAKKMTADMRKINGLLGIEIPIDKAVDILKRLNFGVTAAGDVLSLDVPPYREDIDGYADIAEELIREYGYDHVTGTFLNSARVTNGGYTPAQAAENAVKDKLVSLGMYEISTYSFYSEKDLDMLHFPANAAERRFIKIRNPIGEDLSVMRTTLMPSMLNVIVRNLKRGNTEGKLFEIANVYIPTDSPDGMPEERKMLCVGFFGNGNFLDIKGAIEDWAESLNEKFDFAAGSKPFLHPGITAIISCEGEEIGYVGKIDPKISEELSMEKKAFVAEIDYEKALSHAKPFKYKPLSRFPEVARDLALVADESITCARIESEIYAACKYVSDVKLFDIYAGSQIGENKKSMAYTVTFSPKDEALTPEKIDGFVKKILGNLKHNLNVELR